MINKKKIIALVPARGGSKGIKLKNLKKIKNKSLIEITSDFIDSCKFIDKKFLSSDNKKIIDHSKKLNFEIIKRNKKLSGDKISDFQVINEAIKHIKYKINLNIDYLVYLQPTSPIRKKNHLHKALKKVIKSNFDGSWSITKVDKKFHPLKMLNISKNRLKICDDKGKKIIARQMLTPVYSRNGVFYIFKINKLIKKKTIYLENLLPSITNYQIVNIDTKDDLELAKKLL